MAEGRGDRAPSRCFVAWSTNDFALHLGGKRRGSEEVEVGHPSGSVQLDEHNRRLEIGVEPTNLHHPESREWRKVAVWPLLRELGAVGWCTSALLFLALATS